MDLVAPPSSVLRALFTQVLPDSEVRAALVSAIFEVAAAYALAVAGGLLIGLAVGWTRFGRSSFFPIVMLLYAIPQVVLLPLFTLGFGIGPAAKIAFGFSHGIFPVIVNTVAGMRNVNPLYLSAARCMGARRSDIVRDVILPHITGSLLRRPAACHDHDVARRHSRRALCLDGRHRLFHQAIRRRHSIPRRFSRSFSHARCHGDRMNEIVRMAERRFTRWKCA